MSEERITAQRLPAEVTNLYAELLDQLTAVEAQRSIGHADGSFVTKRIKGRVYYYFQHRTPGARPAQVYVGPKSSQLDVVVARFTEERRIVAADRESIARLCSLLRAGGAAVTDHATARVTAALAEAAVFRLGGVLVGTHAFQVIGNLLGVRWDKGLLRTQDIDVAGERSLALAVPDLRADVPAVLESLEMGFLPVPGLSPSEASTAFKVRGRSLRVDLLTPARKPSERPVWIPRFQAAAEPLPFLDFLLEEVQGAAVIDGGGVLVNVPHPARFAVHKLMISRERPAALQAKRDKDLRQVAQLVQVLEETRPGDLAAAYRDARARGSRWRGALRDGIALLRRFDLELPLEWAK